jgi:hypothetical protein
MRSPRAVTLLLLGFTLLLSTACRPRISVALASGEERLPAPRFVVDDPEHEDRPRYDTVQVVDRAGAVFWQLRAEPYGDLASVRQFSYGESLQGFAVLEAPRELQPGGRYVLFVVGNNRGSLHFDVDAEGGVHAVPP